MKDTANSKLITGCGKKLERYEDTKAFLPHAFFYADGNDKHLEALKDFGRDETGGSLCGYVEHVPSISWYALCRDCCYKNGLIW